MYCMCHCGESESKHSTPKTFTLSKAKHQTKNTDDDLRRSHKHPKVLLLHCIEVETNVEDTDSSYTILSGSVFVLEGIENVGRSFAQRKTQPV